MRQVYSVSLRYDDEIPSSWPREGLSLTRQICYVEMPQPSAMVLPSPDTVTAPPCPQLILEDGVANQRRSAEIHEKSSNFDAQIPRYCVATAFVVPEIDRQAAPTTPRMTDVSIGSCPREIHADPLNYSGDLRRPSEASRTAAPRMVWIFSHRGTDSASELPPAAERC